MWDIIKDFVYNIIHFFYTFCGDWGLAIILVTIIFRIIVAPLMHMSARSSFMMQKIQPLMQEIQTKFADDPVRQNQEMQKMCADIKFNPLIGCLPILLQMPIFIAMYQTLREMGSRVEDGTYAFYNLVPDLVATPGDALSQSPVAFIPYLILMIIFAGATFLPMIMQQLSNKSNPQQSRQMIIMSLIMSMIMLWIAWGAPAGVLLFWGVSSLIGVAQQQISMRYFKKKDQKETEAIEVMPIEVNVTRRVQKKRQTKKR